MADAVDVKTRLVLDDQASSELKNVKRGFNATGKSAGMAQSAVAGFAKQVVTIAIGTALPKIARRVANIATSWLKVSNAAYDSQQAIAGVLMMSRDLGYKQARKDAEGYHREVLDMAIDIGQPVDQMNRGFKMLFSTFGAGKSQMTENLSLLQKMTTVSNVMGFNVERVVGQFSDLATKGTLITGKRGMFGNLIVQTGVFGKDIAKVTQKLTKLDPAQRLGLATKAIGMVAKKMASAEPTFTDLTESAGNTVTLMKEVVGAPVIKALIPVMKDMVARLKASRGAIERYAKTMGKDIARWVKEAATRIQAGFKYLKTHGDEIRESITKAASAIKSAFVYAKKVVDFIIENKEGIAAAFIASKGIGMAGQVASAAGGGMAGAKAGGAFGLAVVAFGFAVQQFAEAQKEGVFTSKAMKDLVAKQESIKRKEAEILGAYKGGKIQSKAAVGLAPRQGKYSKAVDQARASMVATAAAAGENARVAGQMFDNAEALRKKTRAMLIPVEQAVTNFKAIDRAAKKFPDHIMSSDDFKVMNEAIGRVSASFKAAKEAQHIGAMQQIATLLMSSQQAQKAFLASATLTKEGFALLASFVTDEASGFKADLESLAGKKPSKMSKDKAPSAPMNFNINNAKFEIKQDFRDQDPDRVAVVFQRDLKRAAVNRVQSRRASVFGF